MDFISQYGPLIILITAVVGAIIASIGLLGKIVRGFIKHSTVHEEHKFKLNANEKKIGENGIKISEIDRVISQFQDKIDNMSSLISEMEKNKEARTREKIEKILHKTKKINKKLASVRQEEAKSNDPMTLNPRQLINDLPSLKGKKKIKALKRTKK